MSISEQEMELLRDAVNIIVAGERDRLPGEGEEFWAQFRDRLLTTCIKRHEELL